ncbi:hypothetical protein MUG84_18200 [Paenibacillus sp. KQZ6P-2]|uniref:Uncharacterized protein n=1 Tax=Paenibacillus mangrovi TaxID=2931978 RepID=A0A9X1WTK3_9BACL|nr:hypothetical protein [Paenibacillus mangrovi]MCJ8013660.1 hypothetical protein [Paenibacillus mangrovi]
MTRKTGIARLLEIAGEKRGLMIVSGLLSSLGAVCILVPYDFCLFHFERVVGTRIPLKIFKMDGGRDVSLSIRLSDGLLFLIVSGVTLHVECCVSVVRCSFVVLFVFHCIRERG